MSDPIHPILLRVKLSLDDFKRVGEFLRAARSHPPSSIEYEALLHSAILFYARPFTVNAKRKSKLKNEAKKLSGLNIKAILDEHVRYHQKILNLRDQVVAHADAEFSPATIAELKLGNQYTQGFSMDCTTWRVAEEKLDLEIFALIASKMADATLGHIFNVGIELGEIQNGPASGTPLMPIADRDKMIVASLPSILGPRFR
jgi:hypothetical protein